MKPLCNINVSRFKKFIETIEYTDKKDLVTVGEMEEKLNTLATHYTSFLIQFNGFNTQMGAVDWSRYAERVLKQINNTRK